MNELFFELIQVSTGQLDCLNRGPSPEEWQQLYEISKRHGLTALCYKGVVRLFEYGLRAPQDLSIDWMADAEESETTLPDAEHTKCLTHRRTIGKSIEMAIGLSQHIETAHYMLHGQRSVMIQLVGFEQL